MIDTSRLAHPKGSTLLGRAIARQTARRTDSQQLRTWAAAVKARDQWRDRHTGRRVFASRSLDPDRAEAHHIVSKADRAVRIDVRNGLTLSLATHTAVELHQLRIVGTAWFTKGGVRYIDATAPVRFVVE